MLKELRLLIIALAGVAALALAQDEQGPEGAAEPQEGGDRARESGPEGFSREADDDVFIPTEEIPADEEVTFPVDI